jgi:hypothetical protein
MDMQAVEKKETPIMNPTKEGINAAGRTLPFIPRPMLGMW